MTGAEEIKVSIGKLKSGIADVCRREEIMKSPSSFFSGYKALFDTAMQWQKPMAAIKPMMDGINFWTDNKPGNLTPCHAWLLGACIKARYFRGIEAYMNPDIQYLMKSGLDARANKTTNALISCSCEPVMLYFYYCGVIWTIKKEYKRAMMSFEYLLCMRGLANSAILQEALKKMIIVALLLRQDKISLPGCRVLKSLSPAAKIYLNLAFHAVCPPPKTPAYVAVREHLEKNRHVFMRDGNAYLVEVLIKQMQEQVLADLPKTYMCIERPRAMERCGMGQLAFHSAVLKLASRGHLRCKLDEARDILLFRETPKTGDMRQNFTADVVPDLDEQIRRVAELTQTVRAVTERLRMLPPQSKQGKKRAVGHI